MAGPFYPLVKGVTAGAADTGAYTPSAAASGFLAWSVVPVGWVGLVRFDDGTAWGLEYCYWSGTTLSRASTQVMRALGQLMTSTGAHLTLTDAATATMVADLADVQAHFGNGLRYHSAITNATTVPPAIGTAVLTATGTAAAGAIGTGSYLAEQNRVHVASVTTANGQAGYANAVIAGVVSTTAGRGGFEFSFRGGATVIPTGPRLFWGMTSVTFVGNTAEPSALVANVAAFAKDSTDTNIQFLVNSNAGTGTKIDTGIPLVANGWYEATIWCDPGSNRMYGLLIRLDTGAIWTGLTTTDVPANNSLMFSQVLGGLSATTGTAFTLAFGQLAIRPTS